MSKASTGYRLCIALTVLLFGLLLFCFRAERRAPSAGADPVPVAFVISTGDAELCVQPWFHGEQCFLFLPSFAGPEHVSVLLTGSDTVSLGGRTLRDGERCDAFRLNTEYELRCGEAATYRFCMLKSANVSTVFLRTASGGMDAVHADRTHRELAELLVLTPEGTPEYRSASADFIRGHGNSTWELDKKSYNLYLGREASLLGMTPADRYVLVSNAIDDTCLRNRLVYDFAAELEGYEGFSPDCEYADLYLNGDYAGLYLLCEKPKTLFERMRPERGSMLFEITAYGSEEDWPCVPMNGGLYAELHAPDPCTGEQKEALGTALQELREALLAPEDAPAASGKSWRELIDLDSWARKYLIEEVFENADAGFYSQYFFLTPAAGRIFAGPCWDYDGTMGMFELFPNCFWAQRAYLNTGLYSPWYSALWQKAEFRDHVIRLYRDEFLPELNRLTGMVIPDWAAQLCDALEMNRIRWYEAIEDVTVSVTEMTDYLQRHLDFLSSAWLDGRVYHTLTLRRSPGAVLLYYCAEDGSPASALPSPKDLGAESPVWFSEETGEPLDPAAVIRGDMTLTAFDPAQLT